MVITIVVLLILASVTIATLTGENGIITKAGEASEQTKIAGYKESIQLSVQYLVMDGSIFGDEDYPEKLEAEMQNYSNLQGARAQAWGEDAVKVTTEDGYVYWIRENGVEYAGTSEEVGDKMPPPAGWESEKGTGTEPGGNGVEVGKDVGTTNPEDPSNPEYWVDPDNPGEEVQPEDVYPVYKKEVRVTRYIYQSKRMEDLVEYMYTTGDVKEAKPAIIDLGTDDTTKEINGHQVTPYKWVKDLKQLNTVSDIKNLEGIDPNDTVELSSNATYYMVYSYSDDFSYVNPSTGSTETGHQKGYVGSDGETERSEERDPLPEVIPKEEWGGNWETEKGTGKDTNPAEPGIQGGGNGIEEGHDVWTTNPEDPSDKESWIDPTDPNTQLPADEPVYPVFKQKVTASRTIYENQKIADVEGYMYRSYSDDTIKAAEIDLGTSKDEQIGGKTAKAKRWVTDLKGTEEGVVITEEGKAIVNLTEHKDYYLVYSIKTNVRLPDENGDMQEKEVETEVGSDGNKVEGSGEDDKGLQLPKDPKGPDGWDTEDPNVKHDGWVKRETEGEGEGEPIDPKTEIPEEGYDYLPKFIKTITVTRYVYKDQELMPEKTGEVIALGTEIVKKASVELETDTTPENNQINGHQVTPFKWITKEKLDTLTTISNPEEIEGIEPGGTATELEEDESYYMIYKYTENYSYYDGEGTEQSGSVDGYIGSNDTTKEGERSNIPEQTTPPEGWEQEKGTGEKPEGNGIERDKNVWTTDPDHPEDESKWVDPTDPEAKIPDGSKLSPVYSKTVSIIYNTNDEYGEEEQDMPETQTAKIYTSAKKNIEVKKASITITENKPTREKYDFIEWNDKKTLDGTKYDPQQEVQLDADLNLYAVWKISDAEKPTVTFEPDGKNEYAKTYSVSVTVKDNEEVDTSSLKYKWIQRSDNSTELPEGEYTGENSGSFTEPTKSFDTPENVTGNDWYLWIYAKDVNDNYISKSSGAFFLDNKGPEEFTPDEIEVKTSNSVTVTGRTTDSNSGIKQYEFSITEQESPGDLNSLDWKKNEEGQETKESYTFNDLKAGTKYYVRMRATDNLENSTISNPVEVTTTEIPGLAKGTTIKYSYQPETWTPTPVTVTLTLIGDQAEAESNGYELLYSYTNTEDYQDWTKYNSKPFQVQDNFKTIYTRLGDGKNLGKVYAEDQVNIIDKLPPNELQNNLSVKTTTTNSVTVEGSTTTDKGPDDTSGQSDGIKYLFAKDSEKDWAEETKPEHEFTGLVQGESHTFRMKAKDAAGNETKEVTTTGSAATIPSGETEGNITFKKYEATDDSGTSFKGEQWDDTQWTNKKIKVEIEYKKEGEQEFDIQYSTEKTPEEANEGHWQSYTSEGIIVEGNKTIWARLKEKDGTQYGKAAKYEITKIDTLKPNNITNMSYTSDSNSITITGSTTDKTDETGASGKSDIKYYEYRIDSSQANGEWQTSDQTSYTFGSSTTGALTKDTKYTIRMRAVDAAGNYTETDAVNENAKTTPVGGSVTIKPEYKTRPTDTTDKEQETEWDSNWTNQDVVIRLSTPSLDITKYKVQWGVGAEPSVWKDYDDNGTTQDTGLPVLTGNGSITAKIVEVNGSQESTTSTFTIERIDKTVPTITTDTPTQAASVTLTVQNASDGDGSGINDSTYQFFKRVGSDTSSVQGPNSTKSCTYSLAAGTTTVIYAQVTDNAGNVGKSTEITLVRPEEGFKFSEAIDTSTYGNTTRYKQGYSTWRVFYKDASNTYLITDKTSAETNLTGTHSTTSISSQANALNPTWSGSWKTDSSGNKGALYLLEPNNWKTYKTSNASYAVGGPSLDLYIGSYNATQGTRINLIKSTYGPIWSGVGPTSTKDKCYNIYYGGMSRSTGSQEDRWWLACPHTVDPDSLRGPYAGSINPWYATDTLGIRPVVCIPTSTFNSQYE